MRAVVPFALILGFSAYRVHVHTEKWGLVSTNGPLNAVFGRCHNTGLEAVVPGSRGFFGSARDCSSAAGSRAGG